MSHAEKLARSHVANCCNSSLVLVLAKLNKQDLLWFINWHPSTVFLAELIGTFPNGAVGQSPLAECLPFFSVALKRLHHMAPWPVSVLHFSMGNKWCTLPETNSSPLKIGHPKRKLVFQPSISRGYVSFREGNTSYSISMYKYIAGERLYDQWLHKS